MSNKTYQTTLLIRGDAKNAVREVKLTRDELEKLTGAQKKNASATSSFAAAFSKADQSVANATRSLSGFQGVIGALGIGKLISETIQASNQYASLQGQLKLVTSSQQELNSVYDRSLALASETGQTTEATVNLYARLARSTEQLNLGQEKLFTLTKAINQSFIVSGASTQEATSAITQLSQGFAAGTLRGEELNSVMENSPRLARAIAEGLGVTIGQLRQMGADGELTAERITEALTKTAGTIENDFQKMPMTISRVWQAVSNDVQDALGRVDASDMIEGAEELRAVLADPDFKSSITSLASALMDVTAAGVSALSTTVKLTEYLAESVSATLNGIAADDLVRIEDQILKISGMLNNDSLWDFGERIRFFGPDGLVTFYGEEELKSKLKELQGQAESLRAQILKNNKTNDAAKKTTEGLADSTDTVTLSIKEQEKAAKAAEKEQERFNKTLQSTLDRLYPHKAAARELMTEYRTLERAVRDNVAAQSDLDAWWKANGLQEVVVQAERATVEVLKLKDQADPLATAYDRGIERMRDGFGDFFQQILLDGKVTFGDLVDLFKRTVAEMIATAAANRIFLGVGLGGVSGAASAAGGASGLSGLGSLLSIGTGGSLISGIAGAGSALGLGAQTGAFLGSTGQLGYNALSALGIQGAGGTTSFLAGGALTAGAGILGGLAGNALGSSLTGRTSNSNWGAGLGGTAGAFLGGPLGAAIGGAIGGALDSAFGSSKNRIGGVGINTGTREANLWGTKRPEYQDPMQELANVLQGFSDAIGGSGSIMTISRGNKSPLQMDGVEFASVSDLIAAAMDNILDTAWELAPVVKDLAKAFDGSVEETAAFARAMQGLWEQTKINPVSQAVDDFAAAQRTAYDGYRAQMDAIRQMAMEFDGSVASAQTLTQALANNQAAAYQLAQQYLQVGAQIRGSASSSAQSIRESVMTDEERTAALKGRRGSLRDSLGGLTDPGQIASTFAEVVRLNEQIFQSLSPAAQQGQAEAYAKYIERTAEIQENRLEKLRAETEREQRQQNAEVRNALQESAAAQQEAANTMLSAAQAIQAAATALSGGFVGFTGQEVVQ
jgi:tape measure domain-containing protein